jgi:hypothetical protein
MAALLPIRVYRGVPTQVLDEATQLASVPAVYTVPTGKQLILKHIRISNLETTTATSLSFKTGSAINTSTGDFVFKNMQIAGSDVVIFELSEVLSAGDKIYLWRDALSNVAVQISGVEVTL